MMRFLTTIVSGGLLLLAGIGFAQEKDAAMDEPNVATPIEMYSCKYNEGKGAADLDAATKKFNAWADKKGITDYSAWTLVPFYSGTEQDFDVLWLGGSQKARALGRVQDLWVTTGSKEQAGFAEVMTCNTHGAYSALQMKTPPKRDNPSNVIISFSDCNTMEGTTFDDLYMPIMEWGQYKGDNGSTAGMWVFFPTYGGGGESFDFKWIESHQNLEEMGADWDQFSESGWQKGNELFAGKVGCDSSRTYFATSRRTAADDE